ncbi:MAG: tat (twin-arginine translocation) pathway signal sequence [Rariglobus sp.]|jgi:hypothetical protein|nr:tat (twin-arginine translocation) pathway signal sequence [Rariglobus sp.]
MPHLAFSRSLEIDSGWDVIVVGGGPAGCTAAAAAARAGARTLLLEQTQSLGGSGTTALVPAWCPFSDKKQIIYRGLAEKVFRASQRGTPHVPKEQLDWVAINPEQLKRVYDDLMEEHGVKVWFQTFLSSVERNAAGDVEAVVISNKGGLRALQARVYIDCTGDGDLAAWAGASFQKGDEAGELQPATHCFVLSNVNEAGLKALPGRLFGGDPLSPVHAILASGRYPEIPDTHLCHNKIGPGTEGFNAGHLFHVDNTDPASVSKAARDGRRLAEAYSRALAEFAPAAFAESFLVMTGTQVGIRETRRIIGDYVLTLDDWLTRRTFDDEICRNAYFIDLHTTAEEARKKISVAEHRFEHYKPGESHGIPYRCLTPKGLRNVLVAGRNISVERVVHGSIRVMPVCLSMGEAAGLAAALAAQAATPDVHAVDTAELRARLREAGAYLP